MDRLSFRYLDTEYFTKSDYFTRNQRLYQIIDKVIHPEIKNLEIIQDIDLFIKTRYYQKNKLLERDIRNGTINKIIHTICPKKIVSLTSNIKMNSKIEKDVSKIKLEKTNPIPKLKIEKVYEEIDIEKLMVNTPNTPKTIYYSRNVISNW